ncbi:hypothetical protein GALMADRAFT_145872 [Galerina marginata CBS 339.88]|uniref:Uncharacterized protein n=1 Tax=Galerina marginata (strain CBS 339.88) TaxID=685588 RepID=A0A067SPX2_GALM3|nr:hypothetical protein GALMADRAFT_145872 [Galerina marginata CBS 339.88]
MVEIKNARQDAHNRRSGGHFFGIFICVLEHWQTVLSVVGSNKHDRRKPRRLDSTTGQFFRQLGRALVVYDAPDSLLVESDVRTFGNTATEMLESEGVEAGDWKKRPKDRNSALVR